MKIFNIATTFVILSMVVSGYIFIFDYSEKTWGIFFLVLAIVSLFFLNISVIKDEVLGLPKRSIDAGKYEIYPIREINKDSISYIYFLAVGTYDDVGELENFDPITYRLPSSYFYQPVDFQITTCMIEVICKRGITQIETMNYPGK